MKGGYSVQHDHAGELFFRRPDGKAVPHSGYCVDDQLDSGSEPDADGADQEVVEYLKNSQEFFGVDDGVGEVTGKYCLDCNHNRLMDQMVA